MKSPVIFLIPVVSFLFQGCTEEFFYKIPCSKDFPYCSCVEQPDICQDNEKCDQGTGKCVEKDCTDDKSICAPSQKCDTDKKECVAKTCVDDASICYDSQKCDQKTKQCVAKDCTDEPSICPSSKKCDREKKECIPKTCKDKQPICKNNEKCNEEKEVCEVKTCEERCTGGLKCGSNNECYSKTTPGSNEALEPDICANLTIPNNIDYLLAAIEAYANNNENRCDFYDVLKEIYGSNESLQEVCTNDSRCGSAESFAYCDNQHMRLIQNIILGKVEYEYNKTQYPISSQTATNFVNIMLNCKVHFDEDEN